MKTNTLLDRNSYTPLYHQLAALLQKNITDGVWSVGTAIPSEPKLVKQFDVSRNTVREAMRELEIKGFVYRVPGKGTFVAASKLDQRLTGLTGFSEDVRALGIEPDHQNLSIQSMQASSIVAAKLQLSPESKVLYLHRLLMANDLPFIVVKTYLPKRWLDLHDIRITEDELGNGSLYGFLEDRNDVRLGEAVVSIRAQLGTAEERALLDCPEGSPVLVSERTTWTVDGVPIEYSISAGHPDRHQWSSTLVRRKIPPSI